jgi:hypothetical protein
MEKWRLEQFQFLLGQTLVAKELNGDSECELQVSEVNESKSLGEGWESFSVIFIGDREMTQGSLEFTHSDYGNTTVFLNPKSETEYEAVFSYQI